MEDTIAQTFYERLSFWNHLSEDERTMLITQTQYVDYTAGELLHSADGECQGAMFVRRGVLRTYLLSEDGKEATIFRVREHDTCVMSASCALSVIDFDIQIEAETDCSVMLVPSALFARLMNQNVYVENFVYKLTAKRFSNMMEAVQRMFFMSLKQRIISFLLDESARSNSNTLKITQEQLARDIGSAREAVSRSIKQMVEEGGIQIHRGVIEIVDKHMLYNHI